MSQYQDHDAVPYGEVPPPDPDWFQAGPGRALDGAYDRFEYAAAYYCLASDVYPDGCGLTREAWRRLRDAYQHGCLVADRALALVREEDDHLLAPTELAKGRKLFESFERDSGRYLVALFSGLPGARRAGEAPTEENYAGAWCLYRATVAYRVASAILPGVARSGASKYEYRETTLVLDDELHRRARFLFARLLEDPGPKAQEALRRVSRAYILGLIPELAVMARACLESFLADSMPNSSESTLEELIVAAEARGVLQRDTALRAHVLRNAGNCAAHGREITASPDEIVASLVHVIQVADIRAA